MNANPLTNAEETTPPLLWPDEEENRDTRWPGEQVTFFSGNPPSPESRGEEALPLVGEWPTMGDGGWG